MIRRLVGDDVEIDAVLKLRLRGGQHEIPALREVERFGDTSSPRSPLLVMLTIVPLAWRERHLHQVRFRK